MSNYKRQHYNNDEKGKIISHRARCKYCGTIPFYYHTGCSLCYYDLATLPSKPNWQQGRRLNRPVWKRWVQDIHSGFRQAHKNNYRSYRVWVECECGGTDWVYTSTTPNDFSVVNHRGMRPIFDDRYVYGYNKRNERIKYER